MKPVERVVVSVKSPSSHEKMMVSSVKINGFYHSQFSVFTDIKLKLKEITLNINDNIKTSYTIIS